MRLAVLLAPLLAATATLAADLTLHQTVTTTGTGAGTRRETVYLTADRAVVDGDRDRTIVDLPAQTITLVDKPQKTYFTVTAEQLRAQAQAVQHELEQHMADLPPDARAMMERMLGAAKSGQLAVTPTGKHERIAGYDTAEYRIDAGAFTGSVWASETLPLPTGLAQWRRMSLDAAPLQGPGRIIAEAFAKIRGFPMRSTIAGAEPARFTSTTEVTEVREAAPPADALRVPDGFRETAPPAMGGPARPPKAR